MQATVILMPRILNESQRGKALTAKLRAAADKWQQEANACQKRLQETAERQAKLGDTAAPEVAFKLRRDRSVLEMELRSLQERMRFDVDVHREFYSAQVVEALRPVLAELAKERQLGLILPIDGHNDASYVHSDHDLTAEVIRRFDAVR
ncbi:MAG: OmpH family outer membrane protein [Myxococcota bacterium]